MEAERDRYRDKIVPEMGDGISSYLLDSLKYQVERANLRDTLMEYDNKLKEKRE